MPEDEKPNLSYNATDYAAIAAKAGLGFVPILGPIIAEVVGNLIPHQRMDRIAELLKILEQKLKEIDAQVLRQKMTSPENMDLLEDAFLLAARAHTKKRRERIANLTATSFKADPVDYARSKMLMRLLGELTDDEVIVLRLNLATYVYYGLDGDFREEHRHLFRDYPLIGRTIAEFEDEALKNARIRRLVSLGLLREIYRQDHSKGFGVLAKDMSGNLIVDSHEVTRLGIMLLEHLEMIPDWYRKQK